MNPVKKPPLGVWPTPIQELRDFRGILGDGARLFLKRDDLCDIGLGGNKARKLEYLLADALDKRCDCMVTGGGALSNQPVAATACAAAVHEEYLHIHFCSGKGARDAAPKRWHAIECAAQTESILFAPSIQAKPLRGFLR